MKILNVFNKQDTLISPENLLKDVEVNDWIEWHKQNNTFGKPIRWVLATEPHDEADVLSTEIRVSKNGIPEEWVQLKAEYIIEITDIPEHYYKYHTIEINNDKCFFWKDLLDFTILPIEFRRLFSKNKILDKIKNNSKIVINVDSLDEETINYISNSDTFLHVIDFEQYSLKSFLEFYNKKMPGVKFLIWQQFFSYWTLRKDVDESKYKILSLQEFKKIIGFKSENLKTMNPPMDSYCVDPSQIFLTWDHLLILDTTKKYKVKAGDEECILNYQSGYWLLHSNKFEGFYVNQRLKKYTWALNSDASIWAFEKSFNARLLFCGELNKRVNLTWDLIKTLDKNKIYSVYADEENCLLYFQSIWHLHSDKFNGTDVNKKLKKYVWAITDSYHINRLIDKYSIKSLTIDLIDTNPCLEISNDILKTTKIPLHEPRSTLHLFNNCFSPSIGIPYKEFRPLSSKLYNPESVSKYLQDILKQKPCEEIPLGDLQPCVEFTHFNQLKIKKDITDMIESTSKIKDLTLKTIHPDFLPEIGSYVCKLLSANYKEKDGKVFLIKFGTIHVELTIEKLTSLLTKNLIGQEWEKVKLTKSFAILNDLKLVKTITFENDDLTLEDLLK